MNAYSSASPNPYAKRYLTKGRRSLDNNAFIDSWSSSKRIKKESNPHIVVSYEQDSTHNKSETYNFLSDDAYIQNDFHELYDSSLEFDRIHETPNENYVYLNENDSQNIVDENSVFIDGNNEEYSIDFIDDSDSALIDCLNYNQYLEQPVYNSCFIDSHYPINQPRKDKRKQGIVGRPTLSSPQRLLVPDNVYSHGNPCLTETDNYFTDNNYRCRQQQQLQQQQPSVISVSKNFHMKNRIKHEPIDHDEGLMQRNGCRNRPRILSKPTLPESRPITNSRVYYNTTEQDALELAQRTVANREFARNLVKRAERQGTVIDKNKIPMSVFEQQPVEVLMKSALLDENLSGIAEIKDSEQILSQQQQMPFTTINSAASDHPRKMINPSPPLPQPSQPPSIILKKQIPIPPPKPPQITASDILKQKWKAANYRQQS